MRSRRDRGPAGLRRLRLRGRPRRPAGPIAETDPWAAHEARLDPHGRLEFTLGGFLVRTGDRVILVDAGAGTIDTGQYQGGQLLASLANHGVAPGDVTDVIFTHLHFDHVGWATAKGEVVFRNATYRVHEADWAYFVDEPGCRAGGGAEAVPGQAAAGDVQLRVHAGAGVGGQAGARAHPGSTIYVLSSGTQRALLLGDVAHSPVELIEPGWEFVFDVDRAAARAVREQITAELLDSQDLAAAAHFPRPALRAPGPGEATGREWIFL